MSSISPVFKQLQGSKLTFVLSCPWDNHKSCFGCPIESFGCPTPPYVGFHERDFGKGVTDLNDAWKGLNQVSWFVVYT